MLSYVVYYYSCDTAFNSMKKYEVEITVTNTYSLSIEADTINEARTALEGAETFDEFANNMYKINAVYELSMWQQELRDGWDNIVL